MLPIFTSFVHSPLTRILSHFHLKNPTIFPSSPSLLLRTLTAKPHPTNPKPLNTQISQLMRSGLVDAAQRLFDDSPHRNTVTYNSMVRGYFLNGEPKRAVHLFHQMPDRDLFSYNTMISGLMQYKEIDPAREIFETMSIKDIVSWNSMISGYVNSSLMDKAMILFNEMPERNVISWNLVISGMLNLGLIDLAENLFEEMPVKDMVSQTIMISGLLSFGRVDEARRLFDEMVERDIVVWNSLLSGYIRNGRLDAVKALFMKMPERDLCSWNEMIEGLIDDCRLEDAMGFFMEMPQRNTLVWNSILLGLVRGGLLEEAHALFEKNPFKDIVSWTNMIVGYFEIGNVDVALKLFQLMPHRDVTSWNATIFGLGENDFSEEGLKLFLKMRLNGFSPDRATLTTILNMCSILPSLNFGNQTHGLVIRTGFDASIAVSNAIISMYSRCGCIGEAFKAFTHMATPDTISWNSIICGFSYHGKGKEALKLFKRMRSTNVKPDEITFVGVLSACSHSGLIREGKHYFDFMQFKCFIKPGIEHYTSIVDLLGRFGFVEEAMEVIGRMRSDGVEVSGSIWGALLGACRIHGNLEVGEIAGKKVLELEPSNGGAYLILAELYLAGGRKRDGERILSLLKERGVKKEPGCSWIDVMNRVHVFLAGGGSHPETNEVYGMLELLELEM